LDICHLCPDRLDLKHGSIAGDTGEMLPLVCRGELRARTDQGHDSPAGDLLRAKRFGFTSDGQQFCPLPTGDSDGIFSTRTHTVISCIYISRIS
jgi:hypothetical protein